MFFVDGGNIAGKKKCRVHYFERAKSVLVIGEQRKHRGSNKTCSAFCERERETRVIAIVSRNFYGDVVKVLFFRAFPFICQQKVKVRGECKSFMISVRCNSTRT